MPRKSPRRLRADAPTGPRDTVSTLLIGTCPGPPACTAVHSYLFVDGLDVITRSDRRMAGLAPGLLLRPGGPLHPADTPRTVDVAAEEGPDPGPDRLTVRVRLRGETVVWSDLMFPGAKGMVVEEVRFRLDQYLGEIERARTALAAPRRPRPSALPDL
ncbi:hypothetical protein Slala04_66930 [Streptomyces lavendulae subsp. lavendulae]|uniref:hypothetical protein n=1 Tax=Streptomyces TaxID=1883 RepID=UPI000AAA4460|nr:MULTISPECIES: hypothetical protein [unclassified Streptomyces]GLV95240.1 hypothetical protein Slala04_66930 [Streptomyces lavendulae subsp. lavendulae]